jgi:hypothetical protein
MQVCLSENYPKDLFEALQILHRLHTTRHFTFHRGANLTGENSSKTVVFLFDCSLKGLDHTTEEYFQKGYKVFAFKKKPKERIDLFEFSFTVLNLWEKILLMVKSEDPPFIVTYRYKGKGLKKVKE